MMFRKIIVYTGLMVGVFSNTLADNRTPYHIVHYKVQIINACTMCRKCTGTNIQKPIRFKLLVLSHLRSVKSWQREFKTKYFNKHSIANIPDKEIINFIICHAADHKDLVKKPLLIIYYKKRFH